MTEYEKMFHTDPSICNEKLTPEVLKEIGLLKCGTIQAVLPHWQKITGDNSIEGNIGILACELEPMTPDFVRALATALKAK